MAILLSLNPRICAWFQSRLIFPHFTISINHSSIARTNPFDPIRFNPIRSAGLAIWKLLFVFLSFLWFLKQKQTWLNLVVVCGKATVVARARHVLCCLFACWQINNTFHCTHNTIYSECFTGFRILSPRVWEGKKNRNSGIKYVKTVLSTLPVLVRFAMRSSRKWRLLHEELCTLFVRVQLLPRSRNYQWHISSLFYMSINSALLLVLSFSRSFHCNA